MSFVHIVDFNGGQRFVQNAVLMQLQRATWTQPRKKGLIYQNDQSFSEKNLIFIRFSIETAFWTFQSLATIEVNYMDKNPGMFSSKYLISLRLKKERHERLINASFK